MDEVLPGLWVGDLACALSTEYLSLAGVTHIVTALKSRLPPPPTLPCGRSIGRAELLHIPVDDEESEPILVHFPFVNEFISGILEEEWVEGPEREPLNEPRSSDGQFGHWETTGSGTVLVHCQAGCSRSVALVAAYIMATRRITPEQAVEMIKARREQSEPNSGFMDQLQLYYQADFQVDLRHAPIRRFLMSKVNVLNGDSVEDVLMSYYPSPAQSPALSPTGEAPRNKLERRGSSSSTLSSSSRSGAVDLSMSSGSLGDDNAGPRSRRPSRSSLGTSGARVVQQLSVSPAMPDNTDDLFREASKLPPTTTQRPSHWATSISSPHEVLVARSRGNRLPGGVTNIKGHEPRAAKNSTAAAIASAASSSSASASHLPKPHYKQGTMRLRCRMCRREIAARDHIVEHEPGQGIQAFDVRRRNKELRSGSRNEKFAASTGAAAAAAPPTMDQMFGQMARSKISDGEDGSGDGNDGDHGATKAATSSSADTDGDAGVGADASASASAAAAANTSQPSQPQPPPPTSSTTGRPIQSAASLTASLPPHLAALRAGRAPPGAEQAQQNALEQSRARAASASSPTTGAKPPPPHQQQQQQSQSQRLEPPPSLTSRRTTILHSPECSAYFLEPLDWMYSQNVPPQPSSSTTTTTAVQPTEAQSLSSGNLSGKLLCPNASKGKCNAKLGNWDWAGMQCGCGAWVTPGFAVARGRVDEVWN